MGVIQEFFLELRDRLINRKNADSRHVFTDVSNEPFSGTGTVLSMSIKNADMLTSRMQPHELIQFLSEEQNQVVNLIKKCQGIINYQIAGEVLAYWRGIESASAPIDVKSAFSAALSILKTYSPLLNVRIVLADGSIFGNTFGPQQQFQIRGTAVTLAEKLMMIPNENFSDRQHVLLISEKIVPLLNIDESDMRLIRHMQDGMNIFELVRYE